VTWEGEGRIKARTDKVDRGGKHTGSSFRLVFTRNLSPMGERGRFSIGNEDHSGVDSNLKAEGIEPAESRRRNGENPAEQQIWALTPPVGPEGI